MIRVTVTLPPPWSEDTARELEGAPVVLGVGGQEIGSVMEAKRRPDGAVDLDLHVPKGLTIVLPRISRREVQLGEDQGRPAPLPALLPTALYGRTQGEAAWTAPDLRGTA